MPPRQIKPGQEYSDGGERKMISEGQIGTASQRKTFEKGLRVLDRGRLGKNFLAEETE